MKSFFIESMKFVEAPHAPFVAAFAVVRLLLVREELTIFGYLVSTLVSIIVGFTAGIIVTDAGISTEWLMIIVSLVTLIAHDILMGLLKVSKDFQERPLNVLGKLMNIFLRK